MGLVVHESGSFQHILRYVSWKKTNEHRKAEFQVQQKEKKRNYRSNETTSRDEAWVNLIKQEYSFDERTNLCV